MQLIQHVKKRPQVSCGAVSPEHDPNMVVFFVLFFLIFPFGMVDMMPIFIRSTEAAKIGCHYENLTLGSFRKDVVSRNAYYLKILQARTTRLIDM